MHRPWQSMIFAHAFSFCKRTPNYHSRTGLSSVSSSFSWQIVSRSLDIHRVGNGRMLNNLCHACTASAARYISKHHQGSYGEARSSATHYLDCTSSAMFSHEPYTSCMTQFFNHTWTMHRCVNITCPPLWPLRPFLGRIQPPCVHLMLRNGNKP